MKSKRLKVLFIAVCIAVVAMTGSLTLLAKPATSASKIGEKTDQELCIIVIENPMATEAIEELDRRKQQQKQQIQEALTALIYGMAAFKDGRLKVAGRELREANKCPLIKNVAESVLAKPGLLKKIIDECPKYKEKRPCRSCAGSGFECCPNCWGVGEIPCQSCGGYGGFGKLGRNRSTSSFDIPQPCPECGGSGCLPCRNPNCRNQPIIPCKKCHKETGGLLDADDYVAIDTLLGAIGYLHNGGIDFFSEDALKPLLMTTQALQQKESERTYTPQNHDNVSSEDPNLSKIIKIWPNLSDKMRKAIVKMIS